MKVGGITLPETLNAGDQTLILNGGGIRKEFLIKLYAGGLYLKQKEREPGRIIEADEPMAIRMHIVLHMIPKAAMAASIKKGFEKSTNGHIAPIKAQIDEILHSSFFNELRKNDILDLIYLPGEGIACQKNGTPVGTVAGFEFKKALFRIWLGPNPATKDLKKAMLGR